MLILTDMINLNESDKYVALSNLSVYYTWKNIKQLYKNSKFKISAPMLYKSKVSRIRQPTPAKIRPVKSLIKNYETMKSYQITQKPNNILMSLIKKCSFVQV